MSKKRILLVIEALSGGGAELVVANLCKHIDRTSFDVSVCCLNEIGLRGEDLRSAGHDVHVLQGGVRKVDKYLKWWRLAQLAKQLRVDLLHSHSPGSLFDCAVAAVALRRVKHVHTFHFGNYPHMQRRVLLLERVFSRLADKLVAVGREQRRVISRVFRFGPERMIDVVWNGIEIPRSLAIDVESKGRKIILCSISTLIEQKGLSYLLDAVHLLSKRTKDFELWVVGDGPLRGELVSKAAALGLSDLVRFQGWAHNASSTVLPKIDVFVQSSLWEAMSMAVLEAMAAAKPVVVTDAGDNAHLIESGLDGVVVPRMDAERMACELEKLIRSEALRREIGLRAHEKVRAECTVTAMAKNYERLYAAVLQDV